MSMVIPCTGLPILPGFDSETETELEVGSQIDALSELEGSAASDDSTVSEPKMLKRERRRRAK